MSKDWIIIILVGCFILTVAGFAIDAAVSDFKARRP